ncbi:hypothetical protein BJ875DRAFT_386758 [Amylocarpus encephaloides]|uniref:Uncharacterized protein n=1 Tax=Amylocarpus encephaloides TaxID=45428 RepID=A0A9P8C0X6_9HELO|nr:hypothetical protein BJ875DRAFT_386758 [Amylocarpus encephaloides]
MDTALITFMVQTSPYTQSAHLIGSWDNFSKHYPMERDSKRARGQWRGCHAFTDIICDGDGANSPKRTGGLKMGSTYYYYYELDNGIEVHDPTLPFTTSCPYLPGQPVNFLSVPTEVQPLRYRRASMSSMANGDVKTMNPANKFVAPRPSPPTPMTTARATTSPTFPPQKRLARSVSPKSDKLWSARSLFGLRSPPANSTPDSSARNPASVIIPDEIIDEGEDDDNFASQTNFAALQDAGVFTPLSPPPSALRSPPTRAAIVGKTSKPLPELPDETLMPQPLRLRAIVSPADLPRSHFSVSSMGTSISSSSASQFNDLHPSESTDEGGLIGDSESGDEFMYSPISETSDGRDFTGYSLPEDQCSSERTLQKTSYSQLTSPTSRQIFGGIADISSRAEADLGKMSELEELLGDIGYLGDVIVGK